MLTLSPSSSLLPREIRKKPLLSRSVKGGLCPKKWTETALFQGCIIVMGISRIFSYRYFTKNIANIDIYCHCVFTIEMNRERYNAFIR